MQHERVGGWCGIREEQFSLVSPICVNPNEITSGGLLYGGRIKIHHLGAFPALCIQVLILSTFPRFLHLLFKPLGIPLMVSQLIVGLLCGPLVLGRCYRLTLFFFPSKYNETLETLALFSAMFFLFKVGVKTDPTIITRGGIKPLVIGVSCFMISFASGFLSLSFLTKIFGLPFHFLEQATKVIIVSSMTSFPVITCALSDLNILNSDIGHLASSSAMVTDLCQVIGQTILLIGKEITHRSGEAYSVILPLVPCLILVGFVVRPLSMWVVKRTPEGQQVKEIYLTCLFVVVLLSGLASQMMGLPSMLGAFVLGLAIPEGPPLGASVVDRLDYLVTLTFTPLLIGLTGMKTDDVQLKKPEGYLPLMVAVIFFACYVGKLVGVIMSAVTYGVSYRDSCLLGIIMNVRGIVEISVLNLWVESNALSKEANTVVIIAIVILTAISTPVVKYLYDPSTRYLSHIRRTPLDSENLQELCVLACIHSEEDVPSIIRLLEASNPTKIHPLSLTVIHLVELVGRASPILIAHPPQLKDSTNATKTGQIINAFKRFEQRNYGRVSIQPYSTICPFTSMHNDICSVSLDRKASIIIFPLRKQRSDDDPTTKSLNRSIKLLLRNLLTVSPCSVGIFVDSTNTSLTTTISTDTFYRIGLLFLGGPDDREALSFAMNMINHPLVYVTVIRFVAPSNYSDKHISDNIRRQEILDDELIDYFRDKAVGLERLDYQEVEVKDGVETVWVIRDLKDDFDLIMVGRKQCTASELTAGLNDDWSECEELGVLGDLLASSDFGVNGSVLVLQQVHDVK